MSFINRLLGVLIGSRDLQWVSINNASQWATILIQYDILTIFSNYMGSIILEHSKINSILLGLNSRL